MIVWHKKLEVRHQNCAVEAEAWHGSGMFSRVGTFIAYVCACAYIVMIFTIILLLLLYLVWLKLARFCETYVCIFVVDKAETTLIIFVISSIKVYQKKL